MSDPWRQALTALSVLVGAVILSIIAVATVGISVWHLFGG